MKENSLQKYNEGFFHKIKAFFRNLFGIAEGKRIKNEEISYYDMPVKNNYISELRKENKKGQLKDDIVARVDQNPELLEKLPLERLKELDNIYIEKIKERNIEILDLEREIAGLKTQNA